MLVSDSMNVATSSQLGKYGFSSLHNLTSTCYHNEGILPDFTSQIKLTKLPLIHCFDVGLLHIARSNHFACN